MRYSLDMEEADETVDVSQVLPGDLPTETTTPQGPWYEVLTINAAAGVLVVDGGDGLQVDVVFGPGAVVLRRRP